MNQKKSKTLKKIIRKLYTASGATKKEIDANPDFKAIYRRRKKNERKNFNPIKSLV